MFEAPQQASQAKSVAEKTTVGQKQWQTSSKHKKGGELFSSNN